MLHLCRCKRYAGREEVKVQASCNISIFCQWRDPRCDISQLAERKRDPLNADGSCYHAQGCQLGGGQLSRLFQ